jgi:uncharacterized membrane protein (DUF106 family)
MAAGLTLWITQNEILATLIISFILTLTTTLIYKYATDQKKLKALREESSTLRKELMNSKNDPKKLEELNSRSMQISMEQFKHTLKPMLITFLPAILVFGFLNKTLLPSKVIWKLPFSIWKIGDNSGFGWLGIYILSSMVYSAILRKILKVY